MRRLRGLLVSALLGCIPWTALGVAIGLAFRFDLIPGETVWIGTPVPGGLPVALGLAGAFIGAINGLSFGGLVLVSERGNSLENVRAGRFALLGGLATAATLGLLFQNWIIAGCGGVLGAIGAAGALWMARRVEPETRTSSIS